MRQFYYLLFTLFVITSVSTEVMVELMGTAAQPKREVAVEAVMPSKAVADVISVTNSHAIAGNTTYSYPADIALHPWTQSTI